MPMVWNDFATKSVIEFLRDESNKHLIVGLQLIFQRNPQLDRNLVIRITIMRQLGPIPLDPGAKMGLMVRFIELGFSLVDWDYVIRELELDIKFNQESGVIDHDCGNSTNNGMPSEFGLPS